MRVVVRSLTGYKLFSKEYPNGFIISKQLIARELGVRDLGELINYDIDEELGLIKYVTNKFIIEIWR